METATTAPTSAPTNELSNLKLNCRNKANFTTVNFAVEIPSEMMSLPDLNLQSNGVVGTITFLNNSIMVWIGWGKLEASTEDAAAAKATGMPVMGPTTVAMPRTAYRGLSSGDESPCSQLIGGTNEEEVMIGEENWFTCFCFVFVERSGEFEEFRGCKWRRGGIVGESIWGCWELSRSCCCFG
jgi:hypothetical protein